MDTAANILVIVLSVFLAAFLILGIIVAIEVIRLVRVIHRVADKAEVVIESAETVGTIFKNVSGPLALFKVARNIVKAVKK
jgi:hypothetical protein